MTVRYTAAASMEEPALRDIERWKDKIEVRLDNRQVFFLFFGSAVVACMLFVLGVIVGKRIESRGRAEAAPEVQDPLAVLDRAGTNPTATATAPAPAQELTFPKTLIGAPGRAPRSSPAKAAAPSPPKTVEHPAPVKPAVPTAAKAAPPEAPKAAAPGKGKFTLQLSAFPTKEEADAFAKKYASQGAFIVATDIPGKGLWYRVRCGNYASLQEATAAKTTFERQNKVIALVAAR